MPQMVTRLEVRTNDPKWVQAPDGFHSTDKKSVVPTLIDFCNRHNIPYSTDFVSIWAMPTDTSQVKQFNRRPVWVPRNADAYGREIIILGEHVIDSLALVACGDFQNTILKADRLERSGKDVNCYLRDMLFIFPQQIVRAERIATLEQASRKARRYIKLGDAEARLLRYLKDSDKQQ